MLVPLPASKHRRPEEDQGLGEGGDVSWGHTTLEMPLKHSRGDAQRAVASADAESRTGVRAGGGGVGVSHRWTGVCRCAVTGADEDTEGWGKQH